MQEEDGGDEGGMEKRKREGKVEKNQRSISGSLHSKCATLRYSLCVQDL